MAEYSLHMSELCRDALDVFYSPGRLGWDFFINFYVYPYKGLSEMCDKCKNEQNRGPIRLKVSLKESMTPEDIIT